MSKFLINRKDINIDQVEIESEGLTVGRLTGNDLTLNHPTVSRTHAGIKEINGDYWIFNLSEANGTLLNGELIDKTPLADGDLIQIGPFFLYPQYVRSGLQLTVEMSVSPLPVEAIGTGALPSQPEEGKTTRLDPNLLALLQRTKSTPQGTSRLTGTGILSGRLTEGDDQALRVFWDKRKREAGKMATESPLKPQGRRRLGKAQFNWAPTRDLRTPWARSLFSWGAIIVMLLSIAALFFFKDAYSPGVLSMAHARSDLAISPAIAEQANSGSCTTCHSLREPMNQSCASCHTTPVFHSEVSDKHIKSGLTCVSCHTEHQGRSFQPAVVANASCANCHRDGSRYVSPLSGKTLGAPHGGTFGYPVEDGRWIWAGITQAEWERKDLPGTTSEFDPKEQFHLVHAGGRQQGRTNCTDCHVAGFVGDALRQGVRESCAECHGGTGEVDFIPALNFRPPLCVSCHAQHGEEKELRASLRRDERLYGSRQ
ncbi:MAG: FHA domain-containing protein [Acidobacteriota bacterium]|nr:MAG: FHA domain-containing protein [Acidobacteriota bacterium]